MTDAQETAADSSLRTTGGAPPDDVAPAPIPLLEPREGIPPVVASDDALGRVVAAFAAGTGPVAVDAERASGYRYGQRAYLVQLRREGAGSALIDPVGCPDLSGLSTALTGSEWILHAATQDLPCLRDIGMAPTSLFDTELAGRLAGFPRVGLGAMVESVLGYALEKGHSAVDWSTRPLPEPWLRYAALDVELLIDLRDALEERGGPPAGGRSPRRARPAPVLEAPAEAGPRSPLLSVRGLTVVYDRPDGPPKQVVHGVDLDVAPGEIVGLVGESGSGKSQTAFSVLGILPEGGRIGSGSVTVNGRETVGLPEREHRTLRGGTVAYVPQEPMSNLDPAFTIGSQLMEPMRHVLGITRKEARTRALDLLRLVEIPSPERTMRLYPHEISGGMAQRVLIAGAMSCDPELLIADEPTTALDVVVQAEVLELLRRLQRDRGLGVLLVTHNLGVVADLCDRVAVMSAGRIVETGTAEQVVHAPRDPYTRSLLEAVLDDAPPREPWQPREARSTTV
ncbi:ATP-binding cassette domain-containing protein [Streptomyces sp. MBT57]|nr:ATP-binding cassette domain-containing protein [Streptomyces sp. MBT57]